MSAKHGSSERKDPIYWDTMEVDGVIPEESVEQILQVDYEAEKLRTQVRSPFLPGNAIFVLAPRSIAVVFADYTSILSLGRVSSWMH
jgi:hypothetical protein